MSRFLEEIYQQPGALREMLEYYRGAGEERLEEAVERIRSSSGKLLFTGMGSSFYAPLTVRYCLLQGGVATEIWEAGELLHYGIESCSEETVVVAVSQSGESIETRRVVEEVRGKCTVVAITNNTESYLGHSGDVVLPMMAGDEASISAKTYTNTLALLHLLAAKLLNRNVSRESGCLEHLAGGMDIFLKERMDEIAKTAEFLEGVEFLYFIGRGPAMTAAHYGELIFNEGARLPTCALAGGSFRHGPFEMAGEGFTAVFLVPDGVTRDVTMGMAREVAREGGRVLLLTDGVKEGESGNIHTVGLSGFGEDLFSLNVSIPIELLLYHMAKQKGREAGVFEHISKITQRE